MSWNGTITCSHCHQSGHNIMHCNQLAEDAKTNSYYKRKYEEMQAKKNQPRICSYCKGEGHNRRSCKPKKNHQKKMLRAETAWRNAFSKWMTESGPRIGSLIKASVTYVKDDKTYYAGDTSSGWIAPTGLLTSYEVNRYAYQNSFFYHNLDSARDLTSPISFDCMMLNVEPYRHWHSNGSKTTTIRHAALIPGLVPKKIWSFTRNNENGKVWTLINKSEDPYFSSNNSIEEVISIAGSPIDMPAEFRDSEVIHNLIKDWFAANANPNTERNFKDVDDKIIDMLENYVNGEGELFDVYGPNPGIKEEG